MGEKMRWEGSNKRRQDRRKEEGTERWEKNTGEKTRGGTRRQRRRIFSVVNAAPPTTLALWCVSGTVGLLRHRLSSCLGRSKGHVKWEMPFMCCYIVFLGVSFTICYMSNKGQRWHFWVFLSENRNRFVFLLSDRFSSCKPSNPKFIGLNF